MRDKEESEAGQIDLSMGSMQVRLREEGLVHLHTFCEH